MNYGLSHASTRRAHSVRFRRPLHQEYILYFDPTRIPEPRTTLGADDGRQGQRPGILRIRRLQPSRAAVAPRPAVGQGPVDLRDPRWTPRGGLALRGWPLSMETPHRLHELAAFGHERSSERDEFVFVGLVEAIVQGLRGVDDLFKIGLALCNAVRLRQVAIHRR
jgi:hypothetical protein